MEKKYANLSEFTNRDIELFRSSDKPKTLQYFFNRNNNENIDSPYFDLIRFKLEGGNHCIYIKYPNTNFFFEMYNGYNGSGRGDMLTAKGENPWLVDYKKDFIIKSQNNDLILILESSGLEFNFMKKIAYYNKANPFNKQNPYETKYNMEEITNTLKFNYLKLPHINIITYFLKTNEETPKYFIVDHPKYNFSYETHRFFIIENNIIKQLKIQEFMRYRDGGTTIINTIDENNTKNVFFYPTAFDRNLSPKWNDTTLYEVPDNEKENILTIYENI